MTKNLKIKIFGDVQGVGFRFESYEIARQLGIKGFIRNEPDGGVYIEAEGGEKELGEFLDWCRVGPRGAMVNKVDHSFSEEISGYKDFLVK